MIDNKKIETAANKLCDYGSIYDSENRIDGFKKGVNWALMRYLRTYGITLKKSLRIWNT